MTDFLKMTDPKDISNNLDNTIEYAFLKSKYDYKVLLDMDGVIVDFLGGVCKYFNFPERLFYSRYPKGEFHGLISALGITKKELWKRTNNVNFWENLEPTREFSEIMNTLKPFSKNNKLCICTSHGGNAETAYGKIKWIQKHIPKIPYSITENKEFYSNKYNILVDDRDKNCLKFEENGGRVILFPRIQNSNFKYNTNVTRMLYFKTMLTNILLED